jgi:metallo-beta-lactamase class B
MKKLVLSVLLVLSSLALAQETAEWRSWNQPIPPFRVVGNIYYVGANEITSFLITSPRGHILLDGGFAETAPQIEANIEKLGFHLRDVKVLLNSQAHSDHAGGFAELKRATGARLLIAPGDAELVARGGHDDFAFGNTMVYPASKPDGTFKDGEEIRVGDAAMIAHITPGHTRGCTTWTTTVAEGGKSYDVTFLCSVSAPGYRLVNNTKYPNIVDDYRESFRRLKALHTDIFLASHGSFFNLEQKRKAIAPGKPNPFIVPGEFAAFLARSEDAFNAQLAKQQAAAK